MVLDSAVSRFSTLKGTRGSREETATFMPELPDIVVYIEALKSRIQNQRLVDIRVVSPFALRSVSPSSSLLIGREVLAVNRMGKRIVFTLEDDLFVVLHLMIAGRLQWKEPQAQIPGKAGLVAFDFQSGTLIVTEAGPRKRAAVHFVHGKDALAALDYGGLEVQGCSLDAFRSALQAENHTVLA